MSLQISDYQIPRNSLAWMLVAQVAIIGLHSPRLVPWIIAVCCGCLLWRIMVYQGRWSYPSRWIKTIMVICGLIGVPLGYRKFYGLEPAIALLIVAYVLKLLEMHYKRDAYVVIYLGYFVAVMAFLFFQTIAFSLLIVLVAMLNTAALIGLNQTRGHLKPGHTFWLAATLLGQSIPLMIVFFVLFPRIGPLWSVPLQSQIGKTGVSDRMSPGDISRLARSDDLAFRVTFDGELPEVREMYWRGLVLSDFKDGTWSQPDTFGELPVIEWAGAMNAPWERLIERRGKVVNYTVIIEPTQRHWLFALPTPVPHTPGTGLVRDFRLYSEKLLRGKQRYEVTSYMEYSLEKDLTEFLHYRLTLLPDYGNPLSRKLAETLYAESTNQRDYVRRVLQYYNREGFIYSLQPPLLGENNVDGFLMDSRKGFCEHFASSFVFLMRAVAIPSRVVVGYQGGEYNRIGNYLAVHQFDAHAWAEVWFEGAGWQRVDPTSAVAPDRIERGLEAALSGEEGFLADSPLSLLNYRQSLILSEIRLQLGALRHYWDTFVIGYNPTMQLRFLGNFMDDVTLRDMMLSLVAAFSTVMLVITLALLSRRKTGVLDPLTVEYLRFCRVMASHGIVRFKGEGPGDYLQRITAEAPHLAGEAKKVIALYVRCNYAQDGSVLVRDVRKAVNLFRIRAIGVNS